LTDRLTNEELAIILAEDERRAISYRDSTLADEQEVALKFYEAEPFGDEEEGRSQIVVPVVQEVVDYMTIAVLRTMVSGDRVVEFEAQEADQDQEAAEATEAVNLAFLRHQDGYKVLHDWLKAGLIEKVCAVKVACIEEEKTVRTPMNGVPEEYLGALDEADGKIVQASQQEDGTFSLVLEQTKKIKKYVDLPIPNEEFLFATRTRHEDDAHYICHRSRKTDSDLIEMGFDRAMVEDLPNADEASIDSRETERWNDELLFGEDMSSVPGMREHWLREEYRWVDMDGDGRAELVKAFRVGRTILDWEEVEENPFVVFCPFPRPHRMVGNALSDKVMDLQRVRSVLLRQALDGTYMTNAPRMFVNETMMGENTIDDLLTVVPGGIVRGREAPVPLYNPFDPSKSMALMELLVGEQESRTGITRLNQGLDADALNRTATGTALMQAQGQQMEEFVARNFAEAFARLLLKKLRLMIKNGDPMMVKMDGQARTVDPSRWSGDLDVSIRVGLGSGKKEQRLAYRQMVLEIQQAGHQLGLVSDKQLYNNGAGIIRDSALGNPLDYFTDPDSPEGQQLKASMPQPPPDPAVAKAQADMQATQAKTQMAASQMQFDQQRSAMELQQAQAEGAAKIQFMREESAARLQLEHDKAQAEAQLAQQQSDRDFALAQQQAERQFELDRMQAQHRHELALKQAEQLPKNRPGGELDK